jgi:hypothetical protein
MGCAVNKNNPSDATTLEPTGPDVFSSEQGTSEPSNADSSETVTSDVILGEVTLASIEKRIKEQYVWFEYDQVAIIEAFNAHFYLVKAKKETYADSYFAYDAREQKVYLMPLGISFTDSYEIMDESKIIFQMTGENSESNYRDVPYVMTCLKAVNAEGIVEFISVFSEKISPLEAPVDFGGKEGHVLSGLVLTLNGIQLGFMPEKPDDVYYYADYTIPPYTTTAYDAASRTLSLHLSDTIIGENLFAGKRAVEESNQYIEALDITQSGYDVILKIILKNHDDYMQLKFYSVEIVNTLTYPGATNISFYNEMP